MVVSPVLIDQNPLKGKLNIRKTRPHVKKEIFPMLFHSAIRERNASLLVCPWAGPPATGNISLTP